MFLGGGVGGCGGLGLGLSMQGIPALLTCVASTLTVWVQSDPGGDPAGSPDVGPE